MKKRITREMADDAAKELANIAYNIKIEKARMDRAEFGDVLINKYIPKPILDLGKEYSSYFERGSYIFAYIDSGDVWSNREYFVSNIKNPITKAVTISKDDFSKASKLNRILNKLTASKNEYYTNVSDALMQLRTEVRIREQFPEALPYLNFTETSLPSRDYTNLRNLLK